MINSAIYNGTVIHKRFKPKVHSFKYSVFSLLIDLSELEILDKKISFFSLNKFNLISFFEKDHGDRDGSSLKNWVIKQLQNYQINTENIKIKLLCYPRIFGYVFNPLSVFLFIMKVKISLQFYMKLKIHLENNTPMCLKSKMIKNFFNTIVVKNFMFHLLLK
jgi:DUF1365 family protein